MILPPHVNKIIDRLYECGYEAFAVGGCIRDCLLGKTPKDYDVTTNASPWQIKDSLSDYRIIDTGIKYGTVTAFSDGNPIEITTYRVDGEYNDNRRPQNVTFTSSLKEDLKRRDFTVNAMAFNSRTGLIDLFGGMEDLKNGIIRAIGNPTERFNEDGLRIMRALRFASCYSFKISEETSAAVHNCRHLLKNIAGERIAVEFNMLICGDCENVLREYYDVLAEFVPGIEKCVGFQQYTKYHNRDVYEHIIATVAAIRPLKHLRLAMFFHDIGKPGYFTMDDNGVGHFYRHAVGSAEIADTVMKNLKYDKDTSTTVIELIKAHDIIIRDDRKLIKKYLCRYGAERFLDIIEVHIADDMGKADEFRERIITYRKAAETVRDILASDECFSLKSLAVNGNDLKKLGYNGKEIGEKLQFLLKKVINGECPNDKEILINEIKKKGVPD